ncbi:unnamed protein product [Amoebophrya sp. A25]|nr:unnamed protein product [Amoebophrya sp. A25]|eukprot:GSA25T00018276001.1
MLYISLPARGWMCSTKHITKDARSRGQKIWYRKFKSNNRQWRMMKWHLNDLILKQRLHLTLPWCKELQQYAEELIYLAKKNTPHYNGLVESMLISSAARDILYEKLVPRYFDRPFFCTRVMNKWQFRERDAAPMGFIEFVDRPGESQPARPVGTQKIRYIEHMLANGSRRERRIFAGKARKEVATQQGDGAVEKDVVMSQKRGEAPRRRVRASRIGQALGGLAMSKDGASNNSLLLPLANNVNTTMDFSHRMSQVTQFLKTQGCLPSAGS